VIDIIGDLAVLGIAIGVLVLAAVLITTMRRADKPVKPGRDYDERGPYDTIEILEGRTTRHH
jgi:hypothetical protein